MISNYAGSSGFSNALGHNLLELKNRSSSKCSWEGKFKNGLIPCWCCVVAELCWSSRHAELYCCALHIGNGLHGICIKIKKEQSQQYHSNTSYLYSDTRHRIFGINNLWMLLISTAFLLWETFHWKAVCSLRLDLFPTRENIFFRNTSFSPGAELWEFSLPAQTKVLSGRCQPPTVSIFSLCT